MISTQPVRSKRAGPQRPAKPAQVVQLHKRGASGRWGIKQDTGYRWVGADPVLDEVRAIMRDSNLSVEEIIGKVLEASNDQVRMSPSTLTHWLDGHTRRPQNFTLSWVLYALGYHRPITKREEATDP
jgi:hypothetical protein